MDTEIKETLSWFNSDRFKGIRRLHTASQVVEQRGDVPCDYSVAKHAAEKFYKRLRELFAERKSITTFGPYSPGQAVAMKRLGIEGIYLGGWATSAKGSLSEDPGPDLASYPLSQVPDEAAGLVRALLTADRNQRFARARMSEEERKNTPQIDFTPTIIADADTGHGGEPHVRNLIRRFVEVGVPGYHIEDQKPGCKKCGHQGGKVLVPVFEQIKRLNTARFQLDVMGVPGIIVARTDSEDASFLDGIGDERDHPFVLGATNVDVPSAKVSSLAVLREFYNAGIKEVCGHLLYRISEAQYEHAATWRKRVGVQVLVDGGIKMVKEGAPLDQTVDKVSGEVFDAWNLHAGVKTYSEAVADAMQFHLSEGSQFDLSVDEWKKFAAGASFAEAREKARSLGLGVFWDCELPRTPEGYYAIQSGIPYSVARSVAVAPYSDLIWMETKTANLHDAKEFAEALLAVHPEQMMAYNLSPSFNWDTTGMTDDEMRQFPKELGKLGYVFNFITYGGHQVDGVAVEEFSVALRDEGMLALARLQRKIRLLGSPYRTPQTLVGGPRADAALMASTGRTAATKAMGKGSTQYQHLVQTEVPPSVLEGWLDIWRKKHDISEKLKVRLRPHTSGSDLLELQILDEKKEVALDVTFATITDRRERTFLSVRDQNTRADRFKRKRLMTLAHLFLLHRYKALAVHYVTPTDDNLAQTAGMQKMGIYGNVNTEIGQIIVADVNRDRVEELVAKDSDALKELIGLCQ
ncbi:MAG: isocitrate lyase ICL2 [Planctomycetes bacterium]|nr:isocitrate lyase ICL2 [Planctomycetota bacterium]